MSKRISSSQKQTLIEFMEMNPTFAKFPTAEGTVGGLNLWKKLTNKLNADSTGPQKSLNAWKETWKNFKREVRRKGVRSPEEELSKTMNEFEYRLYLLLVGSEWSKCEDTEASQVPTSTPNFEQEDAECVNEEVYQQAPQSNVCESTEMELDQKEALRNQQTILQLLDHNEASTHVPGQAILQFRVQTPEEFVEADQTCQQSEEEENRSVSDGNNDDTEKSHVNQHKFMKSQKSTLREDFRAVSEAYNAKQNMIELNTLAINNLAQAVQNMRNTEPESKPAVIQNKASMPEQVVTNNLTRPAIITPEIQTMKNLTAAIQNMPNTQAINNLASAIRNMPNVQSINNLATSLQSIPNLQSINNLVTVMRRMPDLQAINNLATAVNHLVSAVEQLINSRQES